MPNLSNLTLSSIINTEQIDAVVSERLQYSYVYVYKSAHTTIKRKLWQIENAYGYKTPLPEHYFAVHYAKKTPKPDEQPWVIYDKNNKQLLLKHLIGNYLKFSVVRNPYSRLLSAYLDKMKVYRALTADKKADMVLHYKLHHYPDSFADFVEQIWQKQDIDLNPHWQSQSYIIAFNFIHYHKIGHVENLPDFYHFLQCQFPKIKLHALENPDDILHKTSATSKLIDFYTPELQQQVYQHYQEDFINFGYSENLEITMPI